MNEVFHWKFSELPETVNVLSLSSLFDNYFGIIKMTLVILSSVFAYTLLCAIVPTCDFVNQPPESSIREEYYTRRGRTDSGKPILQNPYPVVSTNNGAVQGYSMGTVHGNRIYAFEGIRYGQPPTGNRRFRAPVPAKPWSGIFTAHKPGPACLQFHPLFILRVIGNEDCLFLNIYVPDNLSQNEVDQSYRNASETQPKIPVIVYFHGGSFVFGEGSEYGPAYLVDQNVILVTLNYRLGPLGFLSTGDLASPGNYGLKDQALALKFLHENIEKFGGDKGRITIMGQSAGAVSVSLHLASNVSRQYFSAGISLSATGFHHWGLYRDKSYALFWTNWLAEIANCPRIEQKSSFALVNCLRKVNGAFLVSYSARIFKWLLFPPVLFAPVVEPEGPEAFLTDTIENIYRRGEVAKYPWIGSLTVEEGYTAIFVLGLFQQIKYFQSNFKDLQSVVFNYDHFFNKSSANELEIVNYKIRKFYFDDAATENVSISTLAQIFSDRYFIPGMVKALKSHSQWAPTYSYLFSFKEHTNNVGKLFGFKKGEWGIGHSEDAFYFLNSSRFYDGFQKKEPAYKLSQIMVNCIGNFAHKRIPFYTNDKGKNLNIWKPVQPYKELEFLEFDKPIKMISNPFVRNIKFWESLQLPDVTPAEIYHKS